uniref:B-box zinc finger protein 32 n=1 Tax=Noccaea caerulescens TaxID=107243 RepID=A0A1J3HWM6_NOCCA
MGKTKCELCGGVARMFCESDQASLCWDCDGKVHGANFLVAKHTRCLLCSACHSPTPWKASGLRLCPTVSICESCVARKNQTEDLSREINGKEYHGAESYEEDEESDEDEDEDEEEKEEEEAENQVVPLDAAAKQLPAVSSSSSVSSGEEASSSGDGGLVGKRTRLDIDTSSSSSSCSRVLKIAKKSRYLSR